MHLTTSLLYAALFFFCVASLNAQSVVINEIMALNAETLQDRDGDYSDWIELCNTSENSMNLGGYFLSDDAFNLKKWTFTSINVPPKAFLIVFASGKNIPDSVEPHLNFKLKAAGETVFLNDSSGKIIDQIDFPEQTADVSFGRTLGGDIRFFKQPTPGGPNDKPAYLGVAPKPFFSHQGGFWESHLAVEITNLLATGEIRYTLNGGLPDSNGLIYQTPISLDGTAVLRAQIFAEGYIEGPPSTRTYLIQENTSLPVISMTTDPQNLWDEQEGIYVLGPNASPTPPYWGANFWQDWERPAHIEFFESGGNPGFQVDAGIKICGGISRTFAQKPFALFARSKYLAKEFSYKIFPHQEIDAFEALVLRNSGNDWFATLFRDGLMHTIVDKTNIDRLGFRPAIVFLNGMYWGIYNIREKANEHYLAAHHGVAPEELDLLELNAKVIHGDNAGYLSLINFIQRNDLSDDQAFQQAAAQIDLENALDYFIAQIYFNNTDWPGNNIKFWRPRTPDGRWRWILFDTDFGLSNPTANSIVWATAANSSDPSNPPWSTFLLRNLLKNKHFANRFSNRFADLLNSAFLPERVVALVDSFENLIAPEIERHQEKWPKSAVNWSAKVKDRRRFAERRPDNMWTHLVDFFAYDGLANLTVKIKNPNAGRLQVNSLEITQSSWTGRYFQNVPLEIRALPYDGRRFAGWSIDSLGDAINVSLQLRNDCILEAAFETDNSPLNAIIFNEINYNSAGDAGDWVELYNRSDSLIDISGWIFKDGNDGHIFEIPAKTSLQTHAYLVLSRDITKFKKRHPAVKNVIGNFGFGLSSSGDFVRLFQSDGVLVDHIEYDDAAPWPTLSPDGTLELMEPFMNNALASSWKTSIVSGGTPGAQNSIRTAVGQVACAPFSLQFHPNFPNPFNAATTLQYDMPQRGHVNLSIFNLLGQRIATLVNEPQNAGSHRVVWRAAATRSELAAGISSGVYLARLMITTNDHEYTKMLSMLYLK